MNVQFYLNGVAVNPPANWQALLIELNFDKDAPDARVTINDWDWIRENSDTINTWIAEGLTGGVGVFEGMPFRIELEEAGTKEILYNGYLDLSTSQIQCNQVTATAKERLSIDYINDIADSFTFEYLAKTQPFGADYIYLPYVISTVPSAQDAILAAVSLITMIIELENALKVLLEDVLGIEVFAWEDLFKILLHVAYIVFLIAAIVKITEDLFNAIIQPVKYHAGMKMSKLCEIGANYMGFDFASETILELEEFEDLVIIPQKWNMEVNDEIDFLQGFTQISTISSVISNDYHQEENGYYDGTFGQLLRDLKTMFNAKVIIEESPTGGRPILRLERIDYSTSQDLYNLPPIDNNDAFRFNVNDFKANYLVEFALDSADKNTFTRYTGTIYQSRTQPKGVPINPDLVLMKGLNQVSIPFALGKRKETLTIPEQVLSPIINEILQISNTLAVLINSVVATAWILGNSLITEINNVIDAVNVLPGGINIPNINPNLLGEFENIPLIDLNQIGDLVDDRIGMLLLENDFINVPKVVSVNTIATQSSEIDLGSSTGPSGVIVDNNFIAQYVLGITQSGINYEGNKIAFNNSSVLSAENIYKKFHYINSFVPTDVDDTDGNPLTPQLHNQWKLYEFDNVPFCFEDYLKVRKDNKIIFVDKFGLVEGIEWNIYNETAKISFRVNELYTLNLENVELIPIGR